MDLLLSVVNTEAQYRKAVKNANYTIQVESSAVDQTNRGKKQSRDLQVVQHQ